jgi:small GTP-binding protein
MALFNYAAKEITLKVVYYGPGLCGKTTNLQSLHAEMSPDKKSKLLSLSTESDRTLFFDFMPIALGKVKDFDIKFQLYTVPGQVRYNATRKLVLKGADAVVFVADSQEAMREQNIESLENMKENLIANNLKPDDIPLVLQYNKRDLNNILSVKELNKDLNRSGDKIIEAAAINGKGVEATFKLITSRLLKHISKKHNVKIESLADDDVLETPPAQKPPAKAQPAPAQPAAEEFVLERSGGEETLIQPATPEPVQDSSPLSEAEIEESIMKTSFPDALTEIPDVPEPPEESDISYVQEIPEGPEESEIPDISEFPGVPDIPDISEFSDALEESEVQKTSESSDVLMMVLEELRESRKQQTEILKALQQLIRKG